MTKEVIPDYSEKRPFGKHEKPLNLLCNKNQINDPDNCLYMLKLVSKHNIETQEQLVKSLEEHHESRCHKCKQQMTNSLDSLVKEMYEAQEEHFGELRYTKDTCRRWLLDLFSRRTIKGSIMEYEAIEKIQKQTDYNARFSSDSTDNTYAVDIVLSKNNTDIAGIQVKPNTYKQFTDKELKTINSRKNTKYDKAVFYLLYDEREEFENLESVMEQVKCELKSIIEN